MCKSRIKYFFQEERILLHLKINTARSKENWLDSFIRISNDEIHPSRFSRPHNLASAGRSIVSKHRKVIYISFCGYSHQWRFYSCIKSIFFSYNIEYYHSTYTHTYLYVFHLRDELLTHSLYAKLYVTLHSSRLFGKLFFYLLFRERKYTFFSGKKKHYAVYASTSLTVKLLALIYREIILEKIYYLRAQRFHSITRFFFLLIDR